MINYPVAIGGVGGSGTRVVAEMLIRSGVHLGSDLNISSDNLNFTRCFKRQNWFENFPDERELLAAWNSFMDQGGDCQNGVPAYSEANPAPKWGWKEPNTHIFLPFLIKNMPEMKYIHVLRNGLDMAFSDNQNQAKNWGQFILNTPCGDQVTPTYSLNYWIAANIRALEFQQKMKANFLLVKYEELCENPKSEVEKILRFVNRRGNLDEHASYVSSAKTIGRHQKEDLSVFSAEQLRQVEILMQTDMKQPVSQTIG